MNDLNRWVALEEQMKKNRGMFTGWLAPIEHKPTEDVYDDTYGPDEERAAIEKFINETLTPEPDPED